MRAVGAEAFDVAVCQQHSSVVGIDQPEKLEELLFHVSVPSEDERLPSSAQGMFNSKVDESFIGEAPSGLRRDEPPPLPQVFLHFIRQGAILVGSGITAMFVAESPTQDLDSISAGRKQSHVVVEHPPSRLTWLWLFTLAKT